MDVKPLFRVGDVVCVRPESYARLSKRGFLYRETWGEARDDNEEIMLGGNYSIKSIDFDSGGTIFYRLLDSGNSLVKESMIYSLVIPASEKKLCPFKIGDLVRFNSLFIETHSFYLEVIGRAYRDFDLNCTHKVTHVINEYYVLIDYEKGDRRLSPFAHEHLELVP